MHMTTRTVARVAWRVAMLNRYPVASRCSPAATSALAALPSRRAPPRAPPPAVAGRPRPVRRLQPYALRLDRAGRLGFVAAWRRRPLAVVGAGCGRPEGETDDWRTGGRDRQTSLPADREHSGEEGREGEPPAPRCCAQVPGDQPVGGR